MLLLGAVALTGGSARADVSSLIVLRPLSGVILALALAFASFGHLRPYRSLLLVLVGAVGLLLLHLVPLPPEVWRALPGRGLLSEIDSAAGLGEIWRPLSADPLMTRNALWSMFVPLAALVLAAQLDERDSHRTLVIVLGLGVVSGVLGVMQFAGGPSSSLYTYDITNNGFAVGLFANRNHQAIFLATLFPLIAAYSANGRRDGRDRNQRIIGTLAVAAMFVPTILATGSRAGLLGAALGIAGAAILLVPVVRKEPTARRGKKWPRWWLPAAIGAIFILLSIMFVGLSQGNAFDRLVAGEEGATELRWSFWEVSLDAARAFFPIGAGIGSFVRVFQAFEPDELLALTYVNHAHNDYVELLLDGGIPAVALAAAALLIVARDSWRVWFVKSESTRVVLGRAASIGLITLAAASAVDYPLRTPLLAAIACLYAVWLRRGALAARDPAAVRSHPGSEGRSPRSERSRGRRRAHAHR